MRIVMDSAGDVPDHLLEELDIFLVPVNLIFGTEEYLSGIDMDHAAFYAEVETVGAHNFPKTSQPTPYQFVEAFDKIIATGEDEILTITVSERLSGTYASAMAAAREIGARDGGKEITFHLFDSKSGSAIQGIMVIEAARMARQGASIKAIMEHLHFMRDNFSVYFLIDSLDYAVKGGRVSSFRSVMASLLNIKPIMTLDDGLIVEAGRVRTHSRALSYIVEATAEVMGDRPVRLAVIHAGKPEAGEVLLRESRACLNVTEEFIMEMSISVAINLGPGALGVVAVPEPPPTQTGA
jgi:DegV family protein with EDD domain